MDIQPIDHLSDSKSSPKQPVVRGARACTTCRAAKMKCVGAEDGQKQCQRCKRANVECVFEKHRRGRKPGSKLSEASKMLRRLEKGLNSARRKSQDTSALSYSDAPADSSAYRDTSYPSTSGTHFPSNELPPLNLPPQYHSRNEYSKSAGNSCNMDIDEDDEDDDDADHNNEALFPAKMIKKENQRNSFFRTILNPEDDSTRAPQSRGPSYSPPQSRTPAIPSGSLLDPIEAGIITEEDARVLFDAIFIRLNPFINLFDPALHTVNYVRSRCRFLFTTLIMCGCRFFKPECFSQCQKMASEFAVQAFAQAWKRVEVVQAFACLTYWRDPDDNRTWTYIGFACRLAVELGLNRYVSVPPPHETQFQLMERRNRERTYLVLFVHDRSLSTQTGRSWMLPEDALVRNSGQWHEKGNGSTRPEDVIVSAFVQLRHIATETTEIFHDSRQGSGHTDIKYDVVLRNCNSKLTQWMDDWHREMQKAGGQAFHFSFMSLFRLYVRVFLNSFGIQYSTASAAQSNPSLQAVSACYTSAIEALRILSQDFADMSMLRYGQDSITIMSAYAAVFLLKLLRSSNALLHLHDGAAREIHTVITRTADAYNAASNLSPASTQAAYHARFLRSLLSNDLFNPRPRTGPPKSRYESIIDPRLQAAGGQPPTSPTAPTAAPTTLAHVQSGLEAAPSHATLHSPTAIYPNPSDPPPSQQHQDEGFHFPASPHLPDHPQQQQAHYQSATELSMRPSVPLHAHVGLGANGGIYHPHQGNGGGYPPHHASELDAQYWKNMFLDLGFGGQGEQPTPIAASIPQSLSDVRSMYGHNQVPAYHHHIPHHTGYSN